MEVQMMSQLGGSLQAIQLNEQVFNIEFKEHLIHQVVVAYQAGARQGSVKQKSRAEVSGGGAKPWRQKGTGRARVGSTRSPLWIGGGRTFAARPRSYEQKVNKKAYKVAMRSIFSELLREKRLVLVDTLKLDLPKTKELYSKLSACDMKNALILTAELDTHLLLASRNIPYVHYDTVDRVNPLMLVAFENIIVDSLAVKKIEEWLA